MINVFKPFIDEREVNAVGEVLRSGWLGLGPKTAEFEKAFSAYTGALYTVAVNSCTAALDMACKLLEIKNGDEVIVPCMTFVSTAHAVAYNLGYPIFCDVDRRTRNICLEDLQRKLTKRTKAIMVVHYGGRPADMDAIREVAGNIPIIEDAAHAAGASYKGRTVGSLSEMACFSFHAVKNLAMGDGGALTLADQELMERAKRLRWLGIDKGTWDRTEADRSYWWEYSVDEVGLKCHLNDIAAAIGLVQLGKLDEMNGRRREIKDAYNHGLADLPQVSLPPDDDDIYRSSWHFYSIECEDRDDLSVYLQEKDIATGVHYKPIHMYKCYGNRTTLPTAESLFPRILTLPMYPGLRDSEVDYVIDCIRSFYRKG